MTNQLHQYNTSQEYTHNTNAKTVGTRFSGNHFNPQLICMHIHRLFKVLYALF